jgi:hypothetical protein
MVCDPYASKKTSDEFSAQEAQARFEAMLKGALSTPHKPLKEKPKAKKATNRQGRKRNEHSLRS